MSLLGSSGFRGIFGQDLTPDIVVKICWAFASLDKNSVVIGWDTRLTSPLLALHAAVGVISAKSVAKLAGLMPTPALAYVSKRADAGIMITASHNPPEYNGVKLFNPDTSSLTPEQYQVVEQRLSHPLSFDWKELKHVDFSNDLLEDYKTALLKERTLLPKPIAIDPGGGAMCKIAANALKQLGATVHAINDEPDGLFKARSSEPSPEALQLLSEYVRGNSLYCGFAFDGDGDRVVVVDEKGTYVPPDSLIAAYASYVIKKSSNKVVVVNLDTSYCVDKAVEEAGGSVVRTKVGDVFIAEKLKQVKGVFGAEPCGAWIHPDFSLCPDGLLSTIRLLSALDELDVSMSEFVSRYKPGIMLREKVRCENKLKKAAMEKITSRLEDMDYVKKETIDGVWMRFKDYSWLLVRPSGTEPYIRVTVEAGDSERANSLLRNAMEIVRTAVEAYKA
ncbi:MAG: hypothetical protein DRJ31_00760 [Candidatus Methanomethylicota archaeon]|uniref:Phosphoglucosamine mutase n=1 Tax=Thermoproteota archaeon TaxID=2056631 RepID=A0A497ETZ0_9CREN|nr:MAG: hypothetical protein DRJ31_00760 [Candidatus Verstraetearchaeota archaeon]RLE52613.1 MAG: hypothetical protein DRJ33_03305 [Candidatus Verstraetearchaeota archaeon]